MVTMQKKYDQLADAYHANRGTFDNRALFDNFYKKLEGMKKGRVLDLGCGIGDGFPEYFIEKGWQVDGVDFSSKMLDLAERYHPQMHVKCQRVEDVELPSDTYDVIESVYALFHLSNADQHRCIVKCYDALKKGGRLFFTYATKEFTGADQFEGFVPFMEKDLFYAHETPEQLEAFMADVGFKDVQMAKYDIGGESFLWVDARK